ncbi:MAG: hypothetical protein ACXABV_05400 [Candidatus Thorarchaeota archaeon]
MFGKGVLKIIGLAVAGAMALAGGAQLLASVAIVIVAFRSGDIIPLVLTIGTTMALIQMKRRLANDTLSSIVGILAYAASGYLAVVAFVGMLPLGLVSSLVGAAVTIMVCSVMYDPSQLTAWMATLSSDSTISWINQAPGSSGFPIYLEMFHQLILIPPDSREMIVTLMRDRPLLPISLTHFNECDVLFIDNNSKRTSSTQVKDIIEKRNIPIGCEASTLLREAILKVPLIDEKHGLAMNEYHLAYENDTIVQLILNPPSRMIVFPSKTGPRIIYPESAAPGLVSRKVPDNELANALLLHNYTNLQEVNDTYENAT